MTAMHDPVVLSRREMAFPSDLSGLAWCVEMMSNLTFCLVRWDEMILCEVR